MSKLKSRRIALKLKQKEVAEKLGVADSAYQRYEGGTRTPSVIMAIKIAKILQTTVEDLFD